MSGRIRANEKIHYIASTTFTIDRIYSDLKLIGKGSYGIVCSALDLTTGQKVAIKKITPMAKDILDAKHVLREIRLMRHMGKHENIISLTDLMVREGADELYIVMELLDSDLHRVLQSPQILTQSHFRFFLHQLLCGVKYLHDNRIIHRDLKPGNLLVSRDCKLRITDFGLARERPTGRGVDPDDDIDEPMTEHVVTRWYRPPELMLCPDGLYTYAVDMWSVGCILAEMLGRRPLFPGKNFIDQLTLIFDVIGSPTDDEVAHIQNSQAKKYLATQKSKRPVPFSKIFPDSATSMHDLLTGLLLFEPNRRLTVDECLESPLFANIGASPSTIYPPTSPSFEFTFEKSKGNKLQLKALIVQEANEVHREYLAKKNEKNPQNDQVTDSRETQTKKRANSTGRPTAVSNNTTSTSTTRPTGRSRPREDSIGHDDDDNASKHSYRSEVTSSTQGTHNRTTNTRSTAPVGSRTNGIGYAQPKEERDRAKSTGRVNLGAKPYHHNVEIDESVGDRSPRRMSHPEETKRIQKDKLEEEVIEPPQAKTTYQQIQSPSRKNKAAMNELDDEIYSKKAMSYLSTSQKPTATQSSYIPRRRSYDSDDDDNNDAVGNNKDVDIRPSTNYNSEIHRNNIQDDTHRSDPPRNTHHIPQPTGTSGVYESQNQYSKTHTTSTSTSTGLKYESEDTDSADEVDMKLAKQYSSHQIRSNILSESELHHVRTASKALEEDDAIPETHYIPPHKASITSTHSNHSRNLYTNSSQLPVPPRTSNNNNHHHPPPRENQPPPAQPQVKTENIPRKKGLTVPKSPQFSKMSWQRKENDRPTVISQQQQQQQQQELKKKKSESGFLGPKPTDKPNMERKRSSSGLKSRPNDGTTDHGHEEIDQHYSQHESHLKTRKSLSSSTRNPSQSSSGATSSIGGGASGGGGGSGGSSAAGRLGRYYC